MESMFVVSSRSLMAPSRGPSGLLHRRPSSSASSTQLPLPEKAGVGRRRVRGSRFLASAFRRGSGDGASQRLPMNVAGKMAEGDFASVSGNSQTSAVGTPALPVPPPPSYVGSPLFWIGVGVGFSALFSWVANYLKKYAMQQAFKAMMGPMAQGNGPSSNSAMFPGSAFPIPTAASPTTPPPQAASPTTAPPPSQAASQPVVTVDISDTKAEPVAPSTDIKKDVDTIEEQKRYSFVDVSPEDVSQSITTEGFRYPNEVLPPNGSTSKQEKGKSSGLSVETLEKMMEDPTVQNMVYPYLPEEMRNPSTFKWMLQNPQYREQLQEMLNNMHGSKEWDGKMMDSLKSFDLNSPEVKQQFDQIGLTPEQVISKIMANPDVATSFQNPKVQAAIMDCSQDPMNIRKYQGDKEVMDVFNKISELFPGVGL